MGGGRRGRMPEKHSGSDGVRMRERRRSFLWTFCRLTAMMMSSKCGTTSSNNLFFSLSFSVKSVALRHLISEEGSPYISTIPICWFWPTSQSHTCQASPARRRTQSWTSLPSNLLPQRAGPESDACTPHIPPAPNMSLGEMVGGGAFDMHRSFSAQENRLKKGSIIAG